jgi:hypothetical protein
MNYYIKSYGLFESRSVQDIVQDTEMSRLGLGTADIKLILAKVHWDRLEIGVDTAVTFIDWHWFDSWPFVPPIDLDSWSDRLRAVKGFDTSAYGTAAIDREIHRGNEKLVRDYLFSEAREHGAEVLHVVDGNGWYLVETGEALPDLRKL